MPRIDLQTGVVRESRPEDYCTKVTNVIAADQGTPAPAWEAFLKRAFAHDPELIPFLQRVLGYGLTGFTTEHVVLFAWGPGANGKSTLFNTVRWIMGTYAVVAPPDMLLMTHSDRHPCDLAMLRGARMVFAGELSPGRAWDEAKLKMLTGGEPITARFIRQDFFTYEPRFLLIVHGNHKPSLSCVDEAIRRRILLVPFTQIVPPAERDPDLPAKLKAEGRAILRWMIDGCFEWQRIGLAPPRSVVQASEDYLGAEDTLGQWLDECCVIDPRVEWMPLNMLYASWCAWCDANGMRRWTNKAFSQTLSERGFARHKMNSGVGFRGLRFRPGGGGGQK